MGKIGNKRKNPAATDAAVIAAYQEKKSIYKVSEALQISDQTVTRILNKAGIERDGHLARARFDQDKSEEIRREYEAGASFADIVQKHGGTEYSVKTAIKRAGGALIPIAPPVNQDETRRIIELHGQKISQSRISVMIGRSQSFVSRVLRNNGIDPLCNRSSRHGMWRGGKFIDGNGYVVVKVDADDPLAPMRNRYGYIPEHRLVVARDFKRILDRSETVHHINGDKTDNRIENLQLRQGKHGKNVAMCCLDCGSQRIGPCPIKD